jgi:tetratricopeptide (TPR) repeat protein
VRNSQTPSHSQQDAQFFSARRACELLGISLAKLKKLASTPSQAEAIARDQISFQDLVLLRSAAGLLSSRIPPSRVRQALARLPTQMPANLPLSAVRLEAEASQVVARDGHTEWHPDSGQMRLNFKHAEHAPKPVTVLRADELQGAADEAFEYAANVEEKFPQDAINAYRRALDLWPDHLDAHINLGRLLHSQGEVAQATDHYQHALALDPQNPTAAFNLAVAFEDAGEADKAVTAYIEALSLEPTCSEAHFNLARLYHSLGRFHDAVRHLGAYRRFSVGA